VRAGVDIAKISGLITRILNVDTAIAATLTTTTLCSIKTESPASVFETLFAGFLFVTVQVVLKVCVGKTALKDK
jgi:hypothetical protein